MSIHTVRDMMAAAYRKINVLGQGKRMDANMVSNGLYALDAFTDMLSDQRLMIYKFQPYVFQTFAGQQVYTLGPANDTPGAITAFILPPQAGGSGYVDGTYANVPISYVTSGNGTGAVANVVVNEGAVIDCQVVQTGAAATTGKNYSVTDNLTVDSSYLGGSGSGFVVNPLVTSQTNWVIPRPMQIEKAYTMWNSGNSPQTEVDIPVALLTMEQYAQIGVKGTPSTFAMSLYDDGNYPVRNITVFPIPQNTVPIKLWLRLPLVVADIASLDFPVDFPEGYERMFIYNLACELASEYGKPIPPEVQKIADESIERLKVQNQKPFYMKGDGGLQGSSGYYGYNWITGYPTLQVAGGGGWWS